MDLKLVQTEEFETDLVFENNDLTIDDGGLETAILVSLLTEQRVTVDEIPSGESSARGWWGDSFPEVDGDLIGSRLWLLERQKHTNEVRELAKEYALEALQWLITDGVAESVSVDVQVISLQASNLLISIARPHGRDVDFKYSYVWSNINGN